MANSTNAKRKFNGRSTDYQRTLNGQCTDSERTVHEPCTNRARTINERKQEANREETEFNVSHRIFVQAIGYKAFLEV